MAKHEQITLPAENASVQERQVTVRVLTIGTKQITQTLYRQLVDEDVIDDETGRLKGDVWGWVNLHVDCNTEGRHLHVIWEDHGQLKRSCARSFRVLRGHSTSDTYDALRSELSNLASIYVCLIALAGKSFNHWKRDVNNYGATTLPLTIKKVVVSAFVPSDVRRFFDAPSHINDLQESIKRYKDESGFCQQQIDSEKNFIKKFLSGSLRNCFGDSEWKRVQYLNPGQYTSHDEVHKAMEEIVDEMNVLEQNWQRSYEALEKSGQLFVAVSGVWK